MDGMMRGLRGILGVGAQRDWQSNYACYQPSSKF
jgi:hypothetical protein